MDESSHPSLRDEALAAVVTVITVTGRFVPTAVEENAVQLLADLWAAGLRYGVQPQDWKAAALPAACIDVLVIVEARRRSSPGTPGQSA